MSEASARATLDDVLAFAYNAGYHEHGYNPLDHYRDEVLREARRRVQDEYLVEPTTFTKEDEAYNAAIKHAADAVIKR